MKGFGSRRGSALLVVLGMMAFIIVSAVAFSAYMRYSRMPSSYLRRTSSSRMLVKAALAEAIERVDAAIGNCPYPGLGEAHLRGSDYNTWNNRVFLGSKDGTFVSAGSTVSTLTMEGLAYIPPAFINEVRYYSRRTPTAEWQTLSYDAGRYAFCAVNVSDCFDINRLIAGSARSSADDGRITLAHCFENPSHTGYTMDPEVWDEFMEDYDATRGGKIPLVSVADLNLAIGEKKPGGIDDLSPFCQYLKQANNAAFVKDNADGNKTVELQRNLAFVTDSYFASTNSATDTIDLSREEDQPLYGLKAGKFKSEDNKKNDDTFDELIKAKNNFFTKYSGCFMPPELVQLYDYLDRDSVPLTLALPTVERVPMVSGVALVGALNVKVETTTKSYPSGQIDPQTKKAKGYVRVKVGKLKVEASNLNALAGLVYPFKYDHGAKRQFTTEAAITITFVPKDDKEKCLRFGADAAKAVITRNDWKGLKTSASRVGYGNKDEKITGVIVMKADASPSQVSLPTKVLEEEDACLTDQRFKFETINETLEAKFDASTKFPGIAIDASQESGTFRLMEEVDESGNKKNGGNEEFVSLLRPTNNQLTQSDEMKAGIEYVPVIHLWVRVLDAEKNVVDLVPACFSDDENESTKMSNLITGSQARPVLRFTAGNEDGSEIKGLNVKDTDALFSYAQAVTPSPAAYLANDPRFNYAPENMRAYTKLEGKNGFKEFWLNEVSKETSSRDGDIFMMTSDAGYLQSAFELTALLDVCGFDGGMDMPAVKAGYNGNRRDTFAAAPAYEAMWRTYSQFGNKRDITRNFNIVSGNRGFRVNPYTSDDNIMMAAFANTPIDWWAASTNFVNDTVKQGWEDSPVRGHTVIKLDDAMKYTFSEFNDAQVKVKYGTRKNPQGSLMQLAQKFKALFRNAGNNWETAFDNDDNWPSSGENADKIAGVDLGVTLHSVDKKFLHGFWRECFANRQHLFLIFLRAEPMMMGGGGLGQTPPQLGARAVALVWRDPTPSRKDPSGPHRTRVLFYRQFE